jgi:hypothetical protein
VDCYVGGDYSFCRELFRCIEGSVRYSLIDCVEEMYLCIRLLQGCLRACYSFCRVEICNFFDRMGFCSLFARVRVCYAREQVKTCSLNDWEKDIHYWYRQSPYLNPYEPGWLLANVPPH